MNENKNETENMRTLPLRSPQSGAVVGEVSWQWSPETRQVILHSLTAVNDSISVETYSAALKVMLRELCSDRLSSAICWPRATDERLRDVVLAAGFVCTGLFMRRSAFSEGGSILFQPLGSAKLDVYLHAHAHKTAATVARFHHHDVVKVFAQVSEDYRQRFASGPCTAEERILALVDADTDQEIGVLWTSFRQEGDQRTAFIEEIEIHEAYKRKGYGYRAVRAIGNASYGTDIDVLSLFVQPDNSAACGLYAKLGFAAGRYELVYSPWNEAGPGS